LGRLYPPRADFLIVLGDMNDWWPWSRLLLRIAETVGAAPRLPTFPSPLPVFALDRMWVRPASALLSLQARSGWRARMASDHLPLHADIALGCEVPRGG